MKYLLVVSHRGGVAHLVREGSRRTGCGHPVGRRWSRVRCAPGELAPALRCSVCYSVRGEDAGVERHRGRRRFVLAAVALVLVAVVAATAALIALPNL